MRKQSRSALNNDLVFIKKRHKVTLSKQGLATKNKDEGNRKKSPAGFYWGKDGKIELVGFSLALHFQSRDF